MKPHFKLSSLPLKVGDRVLVVRSPDATELGREFAVRKVVGCSVFTLPYDYVYPRDMVLRLRKIVPRRTP